MYSFSLRILNLVLLLLRPLLAGFLPRLWMLVGRLRRLRLQRRVWVILELQLLRGALIAPWMLRLTCLEMHPRLRALLLLLWKLLCPTTQMFQIVNGKETDVAITGDEVVSGMSTIGRCTDGETGAGRTPTCQQRAKIERAWAQATGFCGKLL